MIKVICNILISILFGVISVGIAAAQSNPEHTATADTTKYTFDNCINKFSMDKIEKTKGGYQYWFADPTFADGKTLKMSVVGPGTGQHAPHKHQEDEFYFILEGKAEVYLNGTWMQIGPNTSFYCPSNIEHGIRNAGDTQLKYLVIKRYDETNPVRVEFAKKKEDKK
jgi:mannose-6-phosphate isomerase-like protein (cupin superfamily)